MAIVWPFDLLKPRHMEANRLPGTQRGNTSLKGVSQRISSSSGLWRLDMEGFTLGTPQQIKLWRALAAQVDGGLTQIIFPVEDLDRAPLPLGAGSVLHSGGVAFSEGQPWSIGFYDASLSAAAALRATELVIDHTGFAPPEPGHRFSMGFRYYEISTTVEEGANQTTVKVMPPLREARAADAPLRFDRPRLLCRLARGSDMALKPLDHGRWGTADLTLIEDAGPLL